MLEELRNSNLVREKDLGEGISSFNFTNKAFYKQEWNDQTIKARGLFLDTKKDKVWARSFEKFFALDERPETKFEYLKDHLAYPVKVYEKYNGFLGILACHNNKPFFATKSTNSGEYVEYFKDVFDRAVYQEDADKLFSFLDENNCSAVFEVIDPVHDPHIVEYNNYDLVLLNIIHNEEHYHPLDELWAYEVAHRFNLHYKYEDYRSVITSPESFKHFVNKAMNEKDVEGYVLEDSNGYMFKIKNNWYKYWKQVRSLIQVIWKGTKTRQEILEKYSINKTLIDFIYDYKRYFVDCPSVIQVRKDFKEFILDKYHLS